MVPAVRCGSLRKPKIPFCCTLPHGAVSDTLALCDLRDGKFHFCRETGKFNGMTFFSFLKSLRRTSLRTRRRVVVITDNAKYHHALLHKPWRQQRADHFALDYLPP
jgi:hypothetical protein